MAAQVMTLPARTAAGTDSSPADRGDPPMPMPTVVVSEVDVVQRLCRSVMADVMASVDNFVSICNAKRV